MKIVSASLLLSLSACAWLNDQQREVIYRPTRSAASESVDLPAPAQSFVLTVPNTSPPEHLSLWWMPDADPHAPTLLYLHGTFRNLQGNRHKIDALREAGFSVLAVDYRGWGDSSPRVPSEQTINADTRLAWAELVQRQPEPAKRVIYGHSMGSGAAVDLASRLNYPADYGALVLESAFTSFADVAHQAGFWTSLLAQFNPEKFASIDKIDRIYAPLLMLHGSADDTIPIQLGEQLFAAANAPKQWVTIDGGHHSDLNLVAHAQYEAALSAFKARYLSQPP